MRFFLILLVLLSMQSRATAALRDLCPVQPIRFAHYEMGALYGKDRGGIDEDFLKEIIKRSECAFRITILPRARSWYELEMGSIDMMASGLVTPEREKFAWFAPYLVDKKYVLLGPAVPLTIQTSEQFIQAKQLTMGGVRSFRYSPKYDEMMQKLDDNRRLERVGDLETLYRMFASGRFQATIASPLAYRYYLKRYPVVGAMRFMDWDPGNKSISALVLSKKTFSEEQIRQWQNLIRSLIEDGTLLKILTQHLGAEEAKSMVFHP